MNKGIEILCCYSPDDQFLYQKLRQQLHPFERNGHISTWSDADITPGTNWKEEVEKHLNSAEIILLLISPSFISSENCYSVQMIRAMERHEAGEAVVIPVILRPVFWEDAPFAKLQVVPSNKKPAISGDWGDLDIAFHDIAQGIRQTVEEVILKKQARMRSLFGYETEMGRRSDLWEHPNALSFDRTRFQTWCKKKRDFKRDEIIGSNWLKIVNSEYIFIEHFLRNGEFRESLISDPSHFWTASWKLTDGMLRLNIGSYEDDVFANDAGFMHSGIEFKAGQDTPWAYLAFLTYQTGGAKCRSMDELLDLIPRLFHQVLGRDASQRELIMYGSVLLRGELSVRDIVRILALCQEHTTLLAESSASDEVLELCYKKFLGREIDLFGREHYSKELKDRGINWVINDLISSSEYNDKYGANEV